MKIDNTSDIEVGFKVLQTTPGSQTAMMVLGPGENSSEELSIHKKSDQVLLIEGELRGEAGDETFFLKDGDSCIIPAGTPHRFKNIGKSPACTFNVYTPPAY